MAVARHVWPGPDAGVPRGAPIRGHAASDDSRPRDAPFTDSGGGGIPAGSGGLPVCHRADDHHHLLGDRAAGQVVVLATQGENNGGTPSIRCLHIADYLRFFALRRQRSLERRSARSGALEPPIVPSVFNRRLRQERRCAGGSRRNPVERVNQNDRVEREFAAGVLDRLGHPGTH
jgi:hypothetical protein